MQRRRGRRRRQRRYGDRSCILGTGQDAGRGCAKGRGLSPYDESAGVNVLGVPKDWKSPPLSRRSRSRQSPRTQPSQSASPGPEVDAATATPPSAFVARLRGEAHASSPPVQTSRASPRSPRAVLRRSRSRARPFSSGEGALRLPEPGGARPSVALIATVSGFHGNEPEQGARREIIQS